MVMPATATRQDATASAEEDVASANKAGTRFRISGAQVKEAIKDLPSDQYDALWWLSQYCHRHNLGKDQLGRLLKKPNSPEYYSADSIIQLLSGGRIRRGENIQPMVDAIIQLRAIDDARADQITSGFIQTRLYKEIERRCQKAFHRHRIQFIFGDSQIGKTTCLKEYQRTHNHGQTIYVEVPAGGNKGPFLRELARLLNIPDRNGMVQLEEQIKATFDDRMLLIVDEAHRCLNAKHRAGGSSVFDFLRELYNKAGCGIVISMTNEGRKEFLSGTQAKAHQQLWRRRITPLQLPNVTPADDLALFAEAFGLPEATDEQVSVMVNYFATDGTEKTAKHSASPLALQEEVNRTEGLGVWISILEDASDMAKEQRRKITWAAVIKAHAQSLAEAEIYN